MPEPLPYEALVALTERWLTFWRAGLYEPRPVEKERELWKLTADLLEALAHHRDVRVAAGVGTEAMELASSLIRECLAGKLPPAFPEPAGHVLKARTLAATRTAAAYRRLAIEKIIDDRHYNKSVQDAFNVSRSTARSWIAADDDHELAQLREIAATQPSLISATFMAQVVLRRAGTDYRRLTE